MKLFLALAATLAVSLPALAQCGGCRSAARPFGGGLFNRLARPVFAPPVYRLAAPVALPVACSQPVSVSYALPAAVPAAGHSTVYVSGTTPAAAPAADPTLPTIRLSEPVPVFRGGYLPRAATCGPNGCQ